MRQFVVNQEPDRKGKITVTGKDYRYLSLSLRVKKNDIITVRLLSGNLCNMLIEQIDSKKVVLSKVDEAVDKTIHVGVDAQSVDHNTDFQSHKIWLFQFMPKSQKMDLIIRQAVEAGIYRITPIVGEFSVGEGASDSRMSRWQRIIKEARQQSGSAFNLELDEPCSISQALSLWNDAKVNFPSYCSLVLAENPLERKSLHEYLIEKPYAIALAVGSEGGISEVEKKTLFENDFSSLHFFTNILRAETAALYGIAAVQSILSEYDSWHPNA